MKLNDEDIDKLVDVYKDGKSIKELKELFGVHEQTITKYLKQRGVFLPKTHNWTDEDTEKLLEVYPSGDWNLIFKIFPNRSKQFLYGQASKFDTHPDKYYWTEHDKNILINFYNDIGAKGVKPMLDGNYTIKNIQCKAKKMGLTKSKIWTDDEIDILIKNYPIVGATGMSELLPNKSRNAIVHKAMSLGISCECFWSEEEKQFVIDNWENMSDQELAQSIGRGVKGVADQRRKLGLYYPKNDITYYDVADFIRHRNDEWKRLSMQNCKYKCVITGSSDFEIHHTYSFNLILKEAMSDNRWIDKNIIDYSEDELEYILSIFYEYQFKYPLGVCISSEYHRLFHSIYGNRINTPNQWEEFLNKYSKIYQ